MFSELDAELDAEYPFLLEEETKNAKKKCIPFKLIDNPDL